MARFYFGEQNELSQEPVKIIVNWLIKNPNIEWAEDVQGNKQLYYRGDIRFKTKSAPHPEFIEVKIETRTSRQTPNLAIERYSDRYQEKNGGPWNTQAGYYAHLYLDGLLVVMNRHALIHWLQANSSRFKTFDAKNTAYTTSGFLVPRELAKKELGGGYKQYLIPFEWLG